MAAATPRLLPKMRTWHVSWMRMVRAEFQLGATRTMRDLLRGGRTLLVLPDGKKETITMAHSLLPAFITYVDDGISEVLSVLKKLTKAGGSEAAR